MDIYAIIETGGKQYRISEKDTISVEKLDTAPGKTVKLDKVLFYSDGKKVDIGTPYLENVKVSCEVIGNVKTKKTISFKYKRRKSSRRKIGHRQELTKLMVKDIKVG